MKKTHFILLLSLIFICATFFSACIKEHVTGITLNNNELVLSIGDTETLIATVLPADATNKKIVWKSSNPKVATVNGNGLVKATMNGETIITATTKDGNHTTKCNIIVKESDFIVVTFEPELVISTMKLPAFSEYNTQLSFDINQDGVDDIMLKAINQSGEINAYLRSYPLNSNCFVAEGKNMSIRYADTINEELPWIEYNSSTFLFGYLDGEQFFALKILQNNEIHYGWVAVLNNHSSFNSYGNKYPYYIVTKYAFCKTPNKVIFAGQVI
jgi:hypothetical protein